MCTLTLIESHGEVRNLLHCNKSSLRLKFMRFQTKRKNTIIANSCGTSFERTGQRIPEAERYVYSKSIAGCRQSSETSFRILTFHIQSLGGLGLLGSSKALAPLTFSLRRYTLSLHETY